MTLVSLVPDATDTFTGTVTGQPTAHQALADDSGNSWITLAPGTVAWVRFANLDTPAGAVVRDAHVYARLAHSSGTGAPVGPAQLHHRLWVGVPDGSPHDATTTWVISSTAAQWHWGAKIPTSVKELTDAQVDVAQAYLSCLGPKTAIVYELRLRAYYVTQPTVTVTGPSGTVTEVSAPIVYWSSDFDTDGGPQTHYEAQIRDAGTNAIIAESGILGGEDSSWTSTSALADGDYIATARVAQTVNGARHWSATDTQTFTISVPKPADPTLSLFPEATSGRTRLELEDPGGGAVTTDYFTAEASYDGGATFTALRAGTEGLITPTAGAATVYNYDAPNGVLVYYRARSVHEFAGTTATTFSYSSYVKDTDTWTSTDWWLKHPTLPSLNFTPTIRSQPTRQSQIAQGVFHPLGRRNPIVISDIRQAFTGEVVLRCDSDADRAELDAILADGSPLLLQAPPGTYWEDTWFSVSAHERSRPIDSGWSGYTFDSLSWTEVDQPTESRQEET